VRAITLDASRRQPTPAIPFGALAEYESRTVGDRPRMVGTSIEIEVWKSPLDVTPARAAVAAQMTTRPAANGRVWIERFIDREEQDGIVSLPSFGEPPLRRAEADDT
jgi:hypothetical protein